MGARQIRRSIRLPGYDYSKSGTYFVSICTENRKCLFGEIVNQEMVLNGAGRMVKKGYPELENKFQDIRCNEYIIMPNHSHVIITHIGKAPVGADLRVCPDYKRHEQPSGEHTGSPLQRVIQWFKTMTTNEYIRGVGRHGLWLKLRKYPLFHWIDKTAWQHGCTLSTHMCCHGQVRIVI